MSKLILLDMDGVLVNWKEAAHSLHGKILDESSWPAGQYECHEVLGMSEDDFWEPIHKAGYAWWAGLAPHEWAFDLVQLCMKYGDIGISTSPCKRGHSACGKSIWIQHYLPALARRMMIGAPKEWLAAPGRILIDDSDKKVKKFMAAGGRAILFPQKWNSAHADTGDRLSYVEGHLKFYREKDAP